MNRFDKLPVRWRLAITSAGLTFVILLLFAVRRRSEELL